MEFVSDGPIEKKPGFIHNPNPELYEEAKGVRGEDGGLSTLLSIELYAEAMQHQIREGRDAVEAIQCFREWLTACEQSIVGPFWQDKQK